MATFTGWTRDEMMLALERANAHFKGNLSIHDLKFEKILERGEYKGNSVFSCTLTTLTGRRLTKRELFANYPETLRNFEERKELMPDYLYPAGCTVSHTWRGDKPKGVAWGCWHAHGQFYRELFKLNPHGRIKTGIAYYKGETGFNYEFPRTGDMTKGNVCMSDRCSCDDHDIGGEWL